MSVWEPTEEKEWVNFGEGEVLIEDAVSKSGTSYNKITFNIFPLAGGDMVTDTYFKFNNHTKPWDSDVLPPIRDLATAGKIKNAPDISGKFWKWVWRSWRSYQKNDIKYWKDRAQQERELGQEDDAKISAGKIVIDERGNPYVEKRYIHILDVFPTQEAAQAASDAHYGVEGQSSGVWDEAKTEPEPPTGFGDKTTALAFLPNFVKMSMGENHKVDRDKLAEFIEANDVLKVHFTMQSEEVQDAIADAESEPPF